MKFTGGLGVIVEVDRNVSYAEIESALNGQAVLEGYSIDRTEIGAATRIHISVHVPTRRITAEGVPPLPAVGTLRAVADALDEIERTGVSKA